MSEVRLVIREAGRDWSGVVHAGLADRVIAALSADPVTLAELEAALARYEKPTLNRSSLVGLSAGPCDEPHDAGVIVIDLVARLIVVDSTYSSPSPAGEVCYHDGHCATDTWLPYHLAEDWLFSHEGCAWHAMAEERRREKSASPTVDARRVFYGRPLLEFLARETFAADTCHETAAAQEQDTIKTIHAAWLLTPRDDLGGVCPRELALARHKHLDWDLQDQAQRWSLLENCPPGLDESSFAFCHSGFGTHELVLYYELVRELLESCREQLARSEGFTVEDFLTCEVPRLESVRDEWLETPDSEFYGRTPRAIIARERARLPEVMPRDAAVHDADCPCCQMLADLPGPMFWNLDGCNMDDDFAFDIHHRTREEWEAEQGEWEELRLRMDAQMREREQLGLSDGEQGEQSLWSSSFCVNDAADVPLGIRLFGIGGRLAELIVDIRGESGANAATETRRFIDQLNRDFGNLREILQASERSLAEALIEPVISRFSESLAAVTSTYPDLSQKCESLASSLARFLEPASSQSPWDSGNSDSPF